MDHTNLTVALIQMEVRPNIDENLKTALARVETAAQKGAQIICLPELFRTRYFPQQVGTHVDAVRRERAR